LKYSTPIVRWKLSADAAPVGFGGLAAAAIRQLVWQLVRLLPATQRIATQ
jgi:hypothetical protein